MAPQSGKNGTKNQDKLTDGTALVPVPRVGNNGNRLPPLSGSPSMSQPLKAWWTPVPERDSFENSRLLPQGYIAAAPPTRDIFNDLKRDILDHLNDNLTSQNIGDFCSMTNGHLLAPPRHRARTYSDFSRHLLTSQPVNQTQESPSRRKDSRSNQTEVQPTQGSTKNRVRKISLPAKLPSVRNTQFRRNNLLYQGAVSNSGPVTPESERIPEYFRERSSSIPRNFHRNKRSTETINSHKFPIGDRFTSKGMGIDTFSELVKEDSRMTSSDPSMTGQVMNFIKLDSDSSGDDSGERPKSRHVRWRRRRSIMTSDNKLRHTADEDAKTTKSILKNGCEPTLGANVFIMKHEDRQPTEESRSHSIFSSY